MGGCAAGELDAKGEQTYFVWRPFIRKENAQQGAAAEQILHLEGVQIHVVRRSIVVQHEVDGVGGRAEEEELEEGVVA